MSKRETSRTRKSSAKETKTTKRTRSTDHASAGSVRASIADGADGSIMSLVPAGHRALVLGVVVLLVAAFLYVPLRNLYLAKRTELVLQSQYQTLTQINEGIEADLASLQSEEGLENEARRRGYVEEGEIAINLEGLDFEDETATDSEVDSSYGADSFVAPWYVHVLDVLFVYAG